MPCRTRRSSPTFDCIERGGPLLQLSAGKLLFCVFVVLSKLEILHVDVTNIPSINCSSAVHSHRVFVSQINGVVTRAMNTGRQYATQLATSYRYVV